MMHLKGFEKFSLLDFDDKVSAVMFFGGCNMCCPFCHNSEIVLKPNSTPDYPMEEAMEYLKNRKGLIDAVVVTGGEPTLMPELLSLLKDLRKLGYIIKLDTNGTNPKILKTIIEEHLVDYIAMDIKNSFTKYALTAGRNVDLDNIKESISMIMNSGLVYEFRTTLVDTYHEISDIKEIKEMIKGAKKYRLQKFTDHGTCIKKGLQEVPFDTANEFVNELKSDIEDVSLRGY